MAALTSLGLGKTMEKKLRSVGICSAEELIRLGSRQAVLCLKTRYPNTCVVILYYLEAAVRGVEMKQLDKACKSELKAYFRQLQHPVCQKDTKTDTDMEMTEMQGMSR